MAGTTCVRYTVDEQSTYIHWVLHTDAKSPCEALVGNCFCSTEMVTRGLRSAFLIGQVRLPPTVVAAQSFYVCGYMRLRREGVGLLCCESLLLASFLMLGFRCDVFCAEGVFRCWLELWGLVWGLERVDRRVCRREWRCCRLEWRWFAAIVTHCSYACCSPKCLIKTLVLRQLEPVVVLLCRLVSPRQPDNPWYCRCLGQCRHGCLKQPPLPSRVWMNHTR